MTLIDKAEVLAILAPAPNAKDGLWAKRKKALYDQVAALPARGVRVPEIDGWVRRLRKTEEAGHVHHLSKADRLAIADFLAALAPTDAALSPEVQALVEAALKVFADCADLLDEETRETGREYPDEEWAKFRLLVSDYRRARSALAALLALISKTRK